MRDMLNVNDNLFQTNLPGRSRIQHAALSGFFMHTIPCHQANNRDNLVCKVLRLLAEPINYLLRYCRIARRGYFTHNSPAPRTGHLRGLCVSTPKTQRHNADTVSDGQIYTQQPVPRTTRAINMTPPDKLSTDLHTPLGRLCAFQGLFAPRPLSLRPLGHQVGYSARGEI